MNGQDPGSLDNLRDIVEPAAVSWWPLAPGWWFLITLFAFVLLFLTVKVFRNWKARAYRRAALAQLNAATSDGEIVKLLKRTAICASNRCEVGSLSGKVWSQWLADTSGLSMSNIVTDRITSGIYRDGSVLTPELTDFARDWITCHSIVEGQGEE